MLAAIAASPADDEPRRVLADYWIDRGDGDRGLLVQASCERLEAHVHALLAEHGLHWFEPLWGAGFLHDRVEVDRGFLRPLAIPATSALLTDPDLFRMSPIVYRLEQRLSVGLFTETWRATKLGIAGEHGSSTVRLRLANEDQDPVGRERSILERFSNPVIPRVLDVAQSVTGVALVLPVFGEPRPRRAEVGPREVARLGTQLARALDDLHAIDVFHGRIVWTSITTTAAGPLLDDLAQAECELPPIRHSPEMYEHRGLRYLSPEQIRGQFWGAPADVWALAMILIELAQGFHPTRARQSDFDQLQAICEMQLELPIATTALGKVLMRALVAEPERRLSAFALAEQLEAFA